MKKPLAIVLGLSLAAGAAVAGEEGDKKHPQTAADQEIQSETSWDEGTATADQEMQSETSWDEGTATAGNFEDLDVNRDSLISEQEAAESEFMDSEAFAAADTNADGYLSDTEFDVSMGTVGETAVPETEHQENVLEEDPSS